MVRPVVVRSPPMTIRGPIRSTGLLVPRRGDVSGISRWTALAARVLISRLRSAVAAGSDAHRAGRSAECGLKTSTTAGTISLSLHIRPCRLWVRRDLVRHLAEERGVGTGLAGRSRVSVLCRPHRRGCTSCARAMVRPERGAQRRVELDQSSWAAAATASRQSFSEGADHHRRRAARQ